MTINSGSSKNTCPVCGTRVNENATKCLVCGTQLKGSTKKPTQKQEDPAGIHGTRMPMMTLSAPIIILMFLILVGIGGGFTYLALNLTGNIVEPVDTETPTVTLAPTLTPTFDLPTATITPLPSPTPFSYVVQENDSCISIAVLFKTSVLSIVVENGLAADCTNLSIGQELRVPQPTPTATPAASSTPGAAQATIEACEKVFHTVKQNETLSSVSAFYEVPVETIMEWSGKSVDTAFFGEVLTIPLCLRSTVAGATVTPSPAPDYPAPELLRPRNGEAFTLPNETVTLQWAAVSELRENESYLITLTDLTSGRNIELTVSVRDTKFLVPESLRPTDDIPHIFRWSVLPVAQIGVDEDGKARYRESGPASQPSYFTWLGQTASFSTPQP